MLTHKNVMAALISLQTFVRAEKIDLGQSDVFLSFLPLAHIFDRWPLCCLRPCAAAPPPPALAACLPARCHPSRHLGPHPPAHLPPMIEPSWLS